MAEGDLPLRASVIVPARACAPMLRLTLAALRASDLPARDWELIVVDDDSRDDTAAVAARYADRVIPLEHGPHGPAKARNHGADGARGRILAFVDADVCVHAHTLRGLVERLEQDDTLGAVFGAYDTAPAEPGFVSQYRNLVHHWVHLRNAGDAATFWAGCGAVRASAFRHVGGFDAERFPRPQIEDIELGHRLVDHGWRIRLDPALQGTHLKRWTLRGGLLTDIRDRGVPWARLVIEDPGSGRASALNLHPAEKLATALAGGAVATLAVAAFARDARWLLVCLALLALALAPSAPLLRWLARLRGPAFALRAVPLRVLYYLANGLSVIIAVWQTLRARRPVASRPGARQLRA